MINLQQKLHMYLYYIYIEFIIDILSLSDIARCDLITQYNIEILSPTSRLIVQLLFCYLSYKIVWSVY